MPRKDEQQAKKDAKTAAKKDEQQAKKDAKTAAKKDEQQAKKNAKIDAKLVAENDRTDIIREICDSLASNQPTITITA